MVKNPPANAQDIRDVGLITGSGRSPGGGHGNQYSCLENPHGQGNLVGFPGGSVVKNPPASAGDTKDVCPTPGLIRSPGVGNGKPFQYCLDNSMDRGD